MMLRQRNDLVETLRFDRQHKSLDVSVEIRASAWQSLGFHAGILQHAAKLLRIERITIEDEMACSSKKAVLTVSEIARHLNHPGLIGLMMDSSNLDMPRGKPNHEEHVEPNQPKRLQDFHGEEIRSANAVPMGFQEGDPREFVSLAESQELSR